MEPLDAGSEVELEIEEIGSVPAGVIRCTKTGVAVAFTGYLTSCGWRSSTTFTPRACATRWGD